MPTPSSTPDRPALLLDVRSGTNVVVVAAEGEVDLETSPELGRTVEAALADRSHVIVDLHAVTFIDSTGISLLLSAAEQARRSDVELRIEPSGIVRRVLQLTGVENVLPLVD